MNRTRQLAACTLLIGVVAACGKTPPVAGGAAVGQASPATVQSNEKLAQSSNLADPQSFDDAKRGLIASPSGQVFANRPNVARRSAGRETR